MVRLVPSGSGLNGTWFINVDFSSAEDGWANITPPLHSSSAGQAFRVRPVESSVGADLNVAFSRGLRDF